MEPPSTGAASEKPKKTFSSALGISAEEQQQQQLQAGGKPNEAGIGLGAATSPAAAATLFTPPSSQPAVGATVPMNFTPSLPVSAPTPPASASQSQTSTSVDIPGMPSQQQTITTPLNIPGMPPITVSSPVMMPPPGPATTASGSTLTGPPGGSGVPTFGNTGAAPPTQGTPWPNIPQQYQQPQQPVMSTGYYQPQIYDPYNQTANQAPASNVQLFNPVANSTPNPDSSANFQLFDPSAPPQSPATSQ